MVHHHRQSIRSSFGQLPSDLVLRGGLLVDVHSNTISRSDLAIRGHRIVGVFDDSEGYIDEQTQVLDVSGKYILPGLIEPHIHIESSMLTLTHFSRVVLLHGTTTVVNDPHEIANVLGIEGIRQMMSEAHNTAVRFYFTVPSCVPALGGEFETNGASLSSDEMKALLLDERVVGLGEVMNYPGVLSGVPAVLDKIYETYRARGFKKYPPIIDGHSPMLSGVELSAYINAGIRADHECSTGEELEERLRKGMYVMLRNGSSAKNLEDLLEYVIRKKIDTRRLLFCSDDKNPLDLVEQGHINDTLRRATRVIRAQKGWLGSSDLVRMATLNPAEFLRRPYLGKLGIGDRADVAVVDDLENFHVFATIRDGRLAALDGLLQRQDRDYLYQPHMLQTVKISRAFSASDWAIPSSHPRQRVRLIELIPGQILTKESIVELESHEGDLQHDPAQDILKIVVIGRHREPNHFTVGYVRGFGLRAGAVASTIGHDSHNLGIIGTNEQDMLCALEILQERQGGVVVVRDGKVLASLSLQLGGLMSIARPEEVIREKAEVLHAYQQELGGTLQDPIVAMSFLQLPVIPELKITDRSLVKIGVGPPQRVPLFVD